MALQTQQGLLPKSSLELAITYSNIASACLEKGDKEAANLASTKALKIQQEHSARAVEDHAATYYNSLGKSLFEQGYLQAAQDAYQRALEAHQGAMLMALCINNIASVLYMRGDLAAALKEYRKALSIIQRLDPNSLQVAVSN